MDEVSKENQNEKKTLDIFPLSKWKRILVYLCDLIICFFTAFFIMNVMALPIGKAASNYEARTQESDVATRGCLDVLYGHNILLMEQEDDKYHFNENLEFSADCFAEYFVFSADPAAKDKNVILNYFKNVKNDETAYLNLIKEQDKDFGFFEFEATSITLKQVYKDAFKPHFNEGDKMGSNALEQFNTFKKKIFLNSFVTIYGDIQNHDLTYNGISYNELHVIIDECEHYIDILTISASYISMLLSGIIFFLVIPLCNKNGKTVSMMMIRVERIGINNLFLLKKGEVALMSVYQFVSCLGILFFLPVPFFMISEVFRLSPIIITAGLSAIICIVSFIFLMFNKFNRCLFDFLSRTAMISSDSLDDIYRSKGYKI